MTTLEKQRPGVVTFVVILLWIQAVMGAVAGTVALAFRDNSSVQDAVGRDSGELLTYAIIELGVAVLIALVAITLGGGSRGARNLVGIVQGIRIAAAAFLIVYQYQGGLLAQSIVTIVLGLFILWALFANERSEQFFAKT